MNDIAILHRVLFAFQADQSLIHEGKRFGVPYNCGPYGLALAAHRRGFAVRVQVSARTGMFVDGVRDPQKKEVIRLVELDFLQELRRQRIRVETGRFQLCTCLLCGLAAHQGLGLGEDVGHQGAVMTGDAA